MTGVGTLVLVAALAALAGAGMTTALLRRAERRRWRWLDQRAAERVSRWWTPTTAVSRSRHLTAEGAPVGFANHRGFPHDREAGWWCRPPIRPSPITRGTRRRRAPTPSQRPSERRDAEGDRRAGDRRAGVPREQLDACHEQNPRAGAAEIPTRASPIVCCGCRRIQ
ncbi:MAG: hypothetical protein ACRDYA_18220 [Egibacteraceae bacterium]